MSYNEGNPEPLKIPDLRAEKTLFAERIVGQEEAVSEFANLLVRIRSNVMPLEHRPLDSFFLAGPSGVGKTEIVYRLAEILSGESHNRSQVLNVDCNLYQERHQVARLVGSPPGYIGSKDSSTDKGVDPLLSPANLAKHKINFRDKNGQIQAVTLVLFDEIEKAHAAFDESILSILGHGALQLGDNTTAGFRRTIIFCTSNIGGRQFEKLREEIIKEQRDTSEALKNTFMEISIREALRSTIRGAYEDTFSSEFRGRMNRVIIFQHLREQDLAEIARMRIKDLEQELRSAGTDVNLQILPETISWLVKRGYNSSEGARALNKVIQEQIRDRLLLVTDSIHQYTVRIGLDKYGLEPQFFLDNYAPLPDGIEEKLIQKLKQGGLAHYQQCLQDYVNQGVLTSERAKSLPAIRRQLRNQMKTLSQREGPEAVERYTNAMVDLGLATKEEVENLLKEAT